MGGTGGDRLRPQEGHQRAMDLNEHEDLPAVWDEALLARTKPALVVNHRYDRFRGEALTARLSELAP